MGHEIFFKIFDGPQNIFLCSIFVILFFKLRGLEHKISKEDNRTSHHKSHHIQSADIRQIVVKIKNKYLMHLYLGARVFALGN